MTHRPTNLRLTSALLDLANHGQRHRCSDPETHGFWLSEDAEERRLASEWCLGCPVITACSWDAELLGEKFGVWAGVDRSPIPGRHGKTTRTKESK